MAAVRMESVTIGARTASGDAPQEAPPEAAAAPLLPIAAAKEPAPAVGYPAVASVYPPVPYLDQGYASVYSGATPPAAAAQPPVPAPLTVQQQQQAPPAKPFSPFDSMVVTDGTGRRLPPCKLVNPFFLVGCAVHAAVGMLQMPSKALHGDLNTPPKAWRKLPRFSRCHPQQQVQPVALQQQGPPPYATVQYAPVRKY